MSKIDRPRARRLHHLAIPLIPPSGIGDGITDSRLRRAEFQGQGGGILSALSGIASAGAAVYCGWYVI